LRANHPALRIAAAIVGVALLYAVASTIHACTTPSSVEYRCEGGRKIEVDTQHAVAIFGIEILGTRHQYAVVGSCDHGGNIDVEKK